MNTWLITLIAASQSRPRCSCSRADSTASTSRPVNSTKLYCMICTELSSAGCLCMSSGQGSPPELQAWVGERDSFVYSRWQCLTA